MKHTSFPKIGQFRQTVMDVKHMSAYTGKDELGNAIYDFTLPKPTLTFKGTVKLHGTNSGVGYNKADGLWAQSRGNIITPENDNYGFAKFVEDNKESFLELHEHIRFVHPELKDGDDVIIFGEWAGGSIQKGVAISGIEKSLFIFDVKVKPENGEDAYHLPPYYLNDNDNNIYNIEDYLSYNIDIDFEAPEKSQNKLAEITEAVEQLCPVGKAFGVEGIGEGVVWTGEYKGKRLWFKVKGDKHSVTKNKTLAKVDTEKLANIDEFVEYAVTEARLEQGLAEIFPDGQLVTPKIGAFLKWMMSDIIAEESDTMEDNGLTPKDVGRYVSDKAKKYFFKKYNDLTS